jgi:hypothetical protein
LNARTPHHDRIQEVVVPPSNEEVILAVLRSWSDGVEAAQAATRAHFAHDCVWERPG